MKKRYYIYALLLSLAAPFVASCSDWTETEAESFPEEITSEEYYAALRAYKQTDHQVAFGWYSGWNAEGAFMKTSLAGIPDSMDIVSIWDNGLDLSDAQKRDMQFVQQFMHRLDTTKKFAKVELMHSQQEKQEVSYR